MRFGEAQPRFTPHVDRGGSSQPLEGQALADAATTLHAQVLTLLPTIVGFRSIREAIVAETFPVSESPVTTSIGDDTYHLSLTDNRVELTVVTAILKTHDTDITQTSFLEIQTGENPSINGPRPNTQSALLAVQNLIREKLERYSNVPENELPLSTPTRRKFTKEMRGKLTAALQSVHKKSVDTSGKKVDLSGENTKPQTIVLDENTFRIITVEKTALTVETVRSDGKTGSQTVIITLDDTGEFTFEDLVVDPQKPRYILGQNSARAQSLIERKLANLVQEAAPETSIR